MDCNRAWCSLQILCITMMALALAEDCISKREHRDQIIDELGQLPGKVGAWSAVLPLAFWRACSTICTAPSAAWYCHTKHLGPLRPVFLSRAVLTPCFLLHTVSCHGASGCPPHDRTAKLLLQNRYAVRHTFQVRSTLDTLDAAMRELAVQLKDCHSLLFFARGNNYATALEAALKVRAAVIHCRVICVSWLLMQDCLCSTAGWICSAAG